MMQIDLKSITYSILFAIFLVIIGLEQSSAAVEIVAVSQTHVSFGTWILVGLGLAVFGFKVRTK